LRLKTIAVYCITTNPALSGFSHLRNLIMSTDLGQRTYKRLYELAQKHAQAMYDKLPDSDFSTNEQMAIEDAIYQALIETTTSP
jgi:hypothetical protein